MKTLTTVARALVSVWLLTAVFGCASAQKHESTGEYVDNSGITAKVKTALLSEPTLKSMQINVKTFKGVVQLSGFVDSDQMVQKAGEVARNVTGVTEVKNDLTVKK